MSAETKPLVTVRAIDDTLAAVKCERCGYCATMGYVYALRLERTHKCELNAGGVSAR